MITFLFTGGILIFSTITDLKYRKVYNFITFPSMLLGLILAGFPFAGESYYRLLWMVVLLIIGTFRVMGMGDLKLCMAIVALRGAEEAAGMVLVGILLLLTFSFITNKAATLRMLKDTYYTLFYKTGIIHRKRIEYPFAFFLALGYFLYMLIRWCFHA